MKLLWAKFQKIRGFCLFLIMQEITFPRLEFPVTMLSMLSILFYLCSHNPFYDGSLHSRIYYKAN